MLLYVSKISTRKLKRWRVWLSMWRPPNFSNKNFKRSLLWRAGVLLCWKTLRLLRIELIKPMKSGSRSSRVLMSWKRKFMRKLFACLLWAITKASKLPEMPLLFPWLNCKLLNSILMVKKCSSWRTIIPFQRLLLLCLLLSLQPTLLGLL